MTLAVAGGRRRGGCRPPQPPGGRTKQLRRFQVAVFAPIPGPKFESAGVSAVTASPDTPSRPGNLKVRPESHDGLAAFLARPVPRAGCRRAHGFGKQVQNVGGGAPRRRTPRRGPLGARFKLGAGGSSRPVSRARVRVLRAAGCPLP